MRDRQPLSRAVRFSAASLCFEHSKAAAMTPDSAITRAGYHIRTVTISPASLSSKLSRISFRCSPERHLGSAKS